MILLLLLQLGCVDTKCVGTFGLVDDDGDGFGVEPGPDECGYALDVERGDCDDADAAVFPGADETCNERDDDCDGDVDEYADDRVTWYADDDGDGYGVTDRTTEACAAPEGYAEVDGDCDDTRADVSPGASELCAEGDEDCDGWDGEGDAVDATRWYRDRDGDGYGYTPDTSCTQPTGYIAQDGDCNDRDDTVHPGATDAAGDTVDSDCDGTLTCYEDADGDGYGGTGEVESADSDCRDTGEDTAVTDCDDARADTFPGAQETPYDGIDQDCDGEDVSDADGDGWEAVEVGGLDCDDTDADVNPDATERCDFDDVDDDCDGLVDEADPDLTSVATWYADADGDGAGDAATSVTAACPPDGWVTTSDDCDDADPDTRPLAEETCADTVDRNCDGFWGADDHDGDGVAACEECDDGDATKFPGAAEALLDGEDDDCDGLVDEYVGDLTLAAEADVAAFCATYAAVEGSLDLDGLGSLRSLGCLRAVSGHLRVAGVTATNLRGLEALTDVGGDLLLGGWQDGVGVLASSAFTSLVGLERLREVGGDVWVAQNDVADLGGAGRLTTVGGSLVLLDLPLADATLPLTTLGDDLWLEALPDLTTIAAPALASFGGSLWLQDLSGSSGGFTLDWSLPIPGTLALADLPATANAGWVLPDTVGALYVDGTDLADLAGLETLRWIDGDVLITGNASLADLSALDGVEEIGGDLGLTSNPSLAAWDGFAALTRVGGWVRLSGSGPVSADGFGALAEVGEGLSVESAHVATIDGFGALVACPDLELYALPDLTDAAGLAGTPFSGNVSVRNLGAATDLAFLAGVTALGGSLEVADSRSLTSLDGLEALTTVGGAVSVHDNTALTDLSLPSLVAVGGALTLSDLLAVTTLDFGALETVGGDVAVEDLRALPSLGFASLRDVGGLWLYRLDALADLGGLDALTTVSGSLIVEYNPGLTTTDGLDALTTVGGDLHVSRNAALVDLAGLDALTSVGNDLTIDSNSALVRLSSLGALTTIGRDLWVESNGALLDLSGMGTFTVGNTVWLYANPSMTSLDGLDGLVEVPHHLVLANLDALGDVSALGALERVGGDMRITNADTLTTLSGLDNLTEVGGSLEIGDQGSWGSWGGNNAALVTLDGLGGLVSVGDDLWISDNWVLDDISALQTLEAVGGNLGIIDNPMLPTVDAEGLSDGTPVVGGTIWISGNL